MPQNKSPYLLNHGYLTSLQRILAFAMIGFEVGACLGHKLLSRFLLQTKSNHNTRFYKLPEHRDHHTHKQL